MRLVAWAPALALCAGCTVVSSSAYAPGPRAAPSAGPVAVRFTADPPGAVEIGVVEAHGRRPQATLEALVDELRKRVAEVGGDVARVDGFATRYENVTETYTYDCGETTTTTEPRTVTKTDCSGSGTATAGQSTFGGCTTTTETTMETVTKHEPKTCTGTQQVEAAVLTLTGRAFRTGGTKP